MGRRGLACPEVENRRRAACHEGSRAVLGEQKPGTGWHKAPRGAHARASRQAGRKASKCERANKLEAFGGECRNEKGSWRIRSRAVVQGGVSVLWEGNWDLGRMGRYAANTNTVNAKK